MIKKYNRLTGKEEIIGTTNASNIVVDDPSIVSGTTPLTTVISKQNAAVQELRSNVKWLYKYGGTGSGGGVGGAILADKANFQIVNSNVVTIGGDSVIYISETEMILKYKLFHPLNNIKFLHTVYLNDQIIVDNQSITTNIVNQIVLKNLSTDVNNIIRFTSFDESGFNVKEFVLKIVSGSISITSSTVKNNGTITKFYGTGDFSVNFSILNRVKGATTVLIIKLENRDDGKIEETFKTDQLITYNLNVIKDLNNGIPLEIGIAYTVTAQAFTTISNQEISSQLYTFKVSLMNNNSIIITLNDISEDNVSDDDLSLRSYLQGSDISFFYTINTASYNLFRVAFEITDEQDNTIATIGSIYPPGQALDPYDSHDLWLDNRQISKNVSNNFTYSTNKFESSQTGVTYIKIYAWTSDGSIGPGVDTQSFEPTKVAKCTITPSSQIVPNYTTAEKKLYFNMDVPIDFSDLQYKSSYVFKNIVKENNKDIENNTKIDLISCNNVTSGFIKNNLTKNYAGLRISGNSYAKINFNYFNGIDPSSWTMNDGGFTISLTFKSDLHPDDNGTIFSYAIYDDLGDIVTGIEVTLESAKIVYIENGKTRTVKTTIVQNVTTTVDFVCEKNVYEHDGFMKIYLDGVLTAIDVISDINSLSLGVLENNAYIGCKKVNDILTDFCDVNMFNIRVYKTSLVIPDIMKNYIINYAYLNKDAEDNFNWELIDDIRYKNFIDRNWNCIIWDSISAQQTWKTGNDLYNVISSNPALPVILLTETDSSNYFHNLYDTSFNEVNGSAAQDYHTPCIMEMTNINGSSKKVLNMSVTLQGTSSMSYASKNLEIYFGDDERGNPRLFTPKESWLPENRFTLKSDVIDSAHANNTSIGKFINEGGFFEKNYAMNYNGNPYANKVKHTLEGFPIYLFFKFGDRQSPTFLGIYNFNLGRGSSYNMGFKVLSDYKLEGQDTSSTVNYPALVTSYVEKINPYNDGMFSFEINTNSPTDLVGFQQSDTTIVKNIVEQKYPPEGTNGEDAGWSRLYKLYDVLSKMYTGSAPQKYVFLNNQYKQTGEYISSPIKPTMEYFPLNWDDTASSGIINWPNANAYFTIAMAFGMVDSLGKNLTLRSWNVSKNNTTQETKGIFYTSFYDMDTALGLDNVGNEEISPTIFIDYWYNIIEDGYTKATKISNGVPSGIKGYDMPSSRLWTVVREMINNDPGSVIKNYQSYWSDLRKEGGLLSNVNDFMDNYYTLHTKNVGGMMYNLDYSIKYLKKYAQQGSDNTYVTGYNDVKFLHGTRKNYVKSWLNKRLKYIDGCMNISGLYALDGENNKWLTSYPQSIFKDSPYVEQFSGRGNGSDFQFFQFEATSNIPTIFTMSIATTTQRVVLSDNESTPFIFKGTNSSNSTLSWNNVKNISKFKGFGQLNFTSIGLFPMSGLLELDLSNMKSFDNTGQAYFDISYLTELRTLLLENTKAVNTESGFVVDVSKCFKLKTVNIRNSDVGSLSLPGNSIGSINGGVISDLLISGSLLSQLDLKNQQFIKTLDFTGCRRMTSVNINTLQSLETIIFSNNTILNNITITNCPNLQSITCIGNKNLTTFNIDTCEKISVIDLHDCSNISLKININGAYNLNTLNLSGTMSNYSPILPAYTTGTLGTTFYDTLTTLDISNSKIKGFDFGTQSNGSTFSYSGKTESILDLSHFKNLTNLNLLNNTSITYVKFENNSEKPYPLTNNFFAGCTSLRRVFGHIAFNGTSIFNGCISYYIHEPVITGGVTQMPDMSWRGVDTKTGLSEWNLNTGLTSNITYNSTSLQNDFNSTSVSLYDVYYVLNKCDNIVNLQSTFYGCSKIYTSTTDPLNRNTFLHCGKVTNLSSIFAVCTNMRGPVFSPHHDANGNVTVYDGLLSPLVSVTGAGLNSMFWFSHIEYIDDFMFYKLNSNGDKLKITNLDNLFFNSTTFVKDVNSGNYTPSEGLASRILANLPNLVSINYMFGSNNTYRSNINFDTITTTINGNSVTYCPIFFYNTGLTSVTNSFTSINARGSWENIFGGQSELMIEYPNNFPKSFSAMRNSFTVAGTINGETLNYPLRQDMFSRIKNTISAISNSVNEDSGPNTSLYGVINKTYDPISNNNSPFPFEIFKGCRELISIPSFFRNLNYTSSDNIQLPGSILFKDCVKLENVSYTFSSMKSTKFNLTSKGFINCNLKNVSGIFRENQTTLEGKIPYGLFYMETTNNTYKQGWFDNETIYTDKYGFDENGVFLGSGQTIPIVQNRKITYKSIKRTINNMSYAISEMQSPNALPYTLELPSQITSLENCGDLVRYNEKYNTIKYILNINYNADVEPETIINPFYDSSDPESQRYIPNPYYDNRIIIINPSFDPYYRVWNEWCVDGTNIKNTVLFSDLYQNNLTLPRDLPPNFYDINNTYTAPLDVINTGIKYTSSNYVLPSDIFRYCYDNSATSVDYFLAYTNREGSYGDENYGLRGRIPPKLFEPLTQINNLRGVFYYFLYICPYSWNRMSDNTEILGEIYPPNLFVPIGGNLRNVTDLFNTTTMHNKCVIPDKLFYYNTNLQYVTNLFRNCRWYDTVNEQLPSNLFSRNFELLSIRCMLGNTEISGYGAYQRGPHIIRSTLFNSNHKSITDASYFMNWCVPTTGSIPDFWNWATFNPSNAICMYNGLTESKITNIEDAKNSKYSASVTNLQ